MKRKFTKYPSKIVTAASTRPHPNIPEGWERVPEGDDDDGNWGTIAKALPNNQGYYWINIIEDEQGRRCFELEVGYRGDDGSIGKIWKAASKPFYRLGDIVKYADTKWRQLQAEYDEDVEACGNIEASTRIHANSDCYLDTQTGDSYTYDDLKEYWYSFKDWDYSLADFTSFEDWFNTSIENGIFTPCNDVEARGDIKASTYVSQVWLPDDKKWEDIQEYNKWDNSWCEGCGRGPYYDVEDARADGYKARIIVRDESGRYVDDIEACEDIKASTNSKNDDPIYKIAHILSQNSIYNVDDWIEVAKSEVGTIYASTVKSVLKGFIADSLSAAGYNFSDESIDKECNRILREAGVNDVEACSIGASSNPKYMANMVSCASDPELDDDFLVEGFYDNQRRGLAESTETSDVSALNELIYDYANKGYYIVVHNLTDGTITEFSADNWFDDIARDGGAGLFMSW